MADYITIGSVEKVLKLAIQIQKQVKTLHQNEQECQDIEEDVGILIEILSMLQQKPEVIRLPVFNASLMGLERSLNRARHLVDDYQGSNACMRFFRAGDMSRQLRRVHDSIKWKTEISNLATTVLQLELTITLTNTIHYRGAHPPPTQPQDAGVAAIPYGNHITTDDARSGVNSEITIVETGSEVAYAPSSAGLKVFNSSEPEATMHHYDEENISGIDHSFILEQKIVIKISLTCERSRAKAMVLAAEAAGVASMSINSHGADQLLEVVGTGIDCVCLVHCLRKKLGYSEIVRVEELKKKPVETNRGRTIEELENTNTVKVDQDVKEKQPEEPRRGARTSKELENTDTVKVEDVREKKPEEPKRGARKSKKGWAAKACRAVWRQLRRGDKAVATAAAVGPKI